MSASLDAGDGSVPRLQEGRDVVLVDSGSVDVRTQDVTHAGDPLCGTPCFNKVPEDETACENFVGDSGVAPGAGSGGAGGVDGVSDAGQNAGSDAADGGNVPLYPDAAAQAASGGQGGSSSFAPSGDASPDAGPVRAPLDGGSLSSADVTAPDPLMPPATGGGQNAGEPVYACHVRRGEAGPVGQCELAGTGDVGEPCTSSHDCKPGLGCVGDLNAGQCLRFCCGLEDECDSGRYCANRPLRDDADPEPLAVPVCVQADNCKLDDPYPCDPTQAGGCTCPESKMCTVVRDDGTTSCVTPGSGRSGDACPCASGYFCSQGVQTCVKVCKTDRSTDCGTGRCQATAGFPTGFGLCTGMTAEDP